MKNITQIFAVSAIVVLAISGIGYFAFPEIDNLKEMKKTQMSVQSTIDSFDGNLDSVVLTEGKYYSFVFDEKLHKILLHPSVELIDTLPTGITNANISIKDMNDKLAETGAVWIEYEFYNPETGNVDSKTTYLVKHAGYVFGAGYYSP